MTALLTAPCHGCRRMVTWDRIGSQLRLIEAAGRHTSRRHRCRGIPTQTHVLPPVLILKDGRRVPYRTSGACGAWMPLVEDNCARRAGHRNEHRSRYAMDNTARLRRTNWRQIGGSPKSVAGAL